MNEELESITIAIPVLVKIERFTYGYFLGPCYVYRAQALGMEATGNSPNEAAQRLATKLAASAHACEMVLRD